MRIIPTRMGTSGVIRQAHHDLKDHPHAYGDKRSLSSQSTLDKGSSPRVWGQAGRRLISMGGVRIIPTRVGTSEQARKVILPKTDHPHACGDKKLPLKLCIDITGSSPRVWGQVFFAFYT